MKNFLALIICLSGTLDLFAQCCSGGVPMSSNIGLPPGASGTWQLAFNYDLNVLGNLMTGTQQLDKSRERKTHSIIFQTGYTFNNNFSIESFFSWVRQERKTYSSFGSDFTFTQGLGDAIILFKYRLTPVDSKHLLQFGAGPKLPIGSSSESNSRGGIESADLQPGSGSWDGIFWGNYSTPFGFRPSLSVSVSATYKYTGQNNAYLDSTTYQFGSELQVIAGLGDRINFKQIIIDPSISFRFREAAEDKFQSNEFPNTGGTFLYIIPSLGIAITPALSIILGVDVPIYNKPVGTQVVPTYRINTGILYTITPKSDFEIDFNN